MKSVFKLLLVSMAFVVMTGCVTLPSPAEMKKDVKAYSLPKLPDKNKAIVYVVRPSGVGAFVRFNVFVDDQNPESEMGFTRGAQYIYFNLEPGKHKILSKAENWAEMDVTANPGDIIFIQQNASMGLLMARNDLTIPEEYAGRYHVKHLTLGTIIKSDK